MESLSEQITTLTKKFSEFETTTKNHQNEVQSILNSKADLDQIVENYTTKEAYQSAIQNLNTNINQTMNSLYSFEEKTNARLGEVSTHLSEKMDRAEMDPYVDQKSKFELEIRGVNARMEGLMSDLKNLKSVNSSNFIETNRLLNMKAEKSDLDAFKDPF